MAQRRLGLTLLAMLTALADLAASPARAGPELVVGPARQGETTAYRITVDGDGDGAGAQDRTSHSALVTITWKSRTRYLARVGDDPTSVVIAHDTSGALTLENVNAQDAGMVQLSSYLVYFARAAELAAAAARGDRTRTTLHVETARPREISPRLTIERGADQQAADVPVIVTCTRREGMTVIDALGSVTIEGRPPGVRGRPRPVATTTRVAASVEFDAAGVLTHETWQESTDIPEQDGMRTIARTVTIEIAR